MPYDIANALAETVIGPLAEIIVYPRSIAAANRCLYFLGRRETQKYVGLITTTNCQAAIPGAPRSIRLNNAALHLVLTETDTKTSGVMQEALSFLKPRVTGTAPSVGCGDRLGLATPGHIQAVRKAGLAPILAQQSVRENERTGRTPADVMADAVWGVFEAGWRDGFGADADHLKTPEALDPFVDAGYTFFTIDPGDHVDARADTAATADLEALVQALPWDALESRPPDLNRALCQKPLDLDGQPCPLTEVQVQRAAVKYGRVVAHTVSMYRHLKNRLAGRPFELEVSVDETDTVTSLAEHIYIATELKRLGVHWVSLAPRYVGDFEKGVDYIGDLETFDASFAQHAAVARTLGPYKLSLHSGSDKFRIYPIAARHTRGLVHLKTAGTSYLEALRATAMTDPDLFRRIMALAVERYPVDRASYHVSARIDKLPPFRQMPDDTLPELLEDFHAREILHVTYGSVLNHPTLRPAFFAALKTNASLYTTLIANHFDRHLQPFMRP
ncbi:MAG: tagaturonate epimerase family protein [Deltaproteobacteria bacterium]|nr:tagaturonate epimerase family protein [Deltaproteobacteria bacterium]